MTCSLWRVSDNRGDSGPRSTILRENPEAPGTVEYKNFEPPTVGWAIQVGSINGRTYAAQDYWQTTYVTEILEDDEREETETYTILGVEKTVTNKVHYVRFKTMNSEYVWRRYLR